MIRVGRDLGSGDQAHCADVVGWAGDGLDGMEEAGIHGPEPVEAGPAGYTGIEDYGIEVRVCL